MEKSIKDGIDELGIKSIHIKSGSKKRITITIPEEILDYVDYYQKSLGFTTRSAAINDIMQRFFTSLAKKVD